MAFTYNYLASSMKSLTLALKGELRILKFRFLFRGTGTKFILRHPRSILQIFFFVRIFPGPGFTFLLVSTSLRLAHFPCL